MSFEYRNLVIRRTEDGKIKIDRKTGGGFVPIPVQGTPEQMAAEIGRVLLKKNNIVDLEDYKSKFGAWLRENVQFSPVEAPDVTAPTTISMAAPRTQQDLLGRKVAVLAVGAKGVISFKGVVTSVDEQFIVLEVEKGGLLAGKGKRQNTFFSKNAILGIRVEE